jgi:hypothetical protein
MQRSSFILFLAAACSPGTPTPDASTDGTPNDVTVDTGQDSGAPTDASSDVVVDAPFDAGPCSLMPVDGGACNSLTVTGTPVTPACVNTASPTPVGGPIYNGFYVLSKIEYYQPTGPCPTQTEQIDWSICGSSWETVQVGGTTTTRVNATVTASQTTLSLELSCPNSGLSVWGYDATSTTLVLYLKLNVDGGAFYRADTYAKM